VVWPVKIDAGTLPKDSGVHLYLQPLRIRDKSAWDEVRSFNRDWLQPWEATRPTLPDERVDYSGQGLSLPSYVEMVRSHRKEGRALRSISLAMWLADRSGGRLVGQITLGGIVFGAMRGAHIGYWVDSRVANRGVTTLAVQAITDFGFTELALHRIEINLRPENGSSTRVAEKAGFIFEGMRPNYLHINGGWRDHATYVRENPEIR
jgi:[ribosomal protein S5]-alanine N-acetyltransferase